MHGKSRSGSGGEVRLRLIDAKASGYDGGPPSSASERIRAHADVRGGLHEIEDALYLDTLAAYQQEFLAHLYAQHTAEAGVKGAVLFHLDWIARNAALAHYLVFFSSAWLSSEQFVKLEGMNAEYAQAAGAWREPHVAAGRIRRLPETVYGPVVLGPARQLGSQILARSAPEELPAAVRQVGPALAEAAWLAVRGERYEDDDSADPSSRWPSVLGGPRPESAARQARENGR